MLFLEVSLLAKILCYALDSIKQFKGSLGSYDLILTEDGSLTFKSHFFDECAHSTSGALAETKYHYIEGSGICDSINPKLLEVGFGTGLGLLTTLNSLNFDQKEKLQYLGLELDEELVKYAITSNPLLNGFIKAEKDGLNYYQRNDLIILIGDALETLKPFTDLFKLRFNYIYQDPFSPKKNPALWTQKWFELLKSASNKNCRLSTYSASQSVRKNLESAGWIISEGGPFGKKRSSTRATLE